MLTPRFSLSQDETSLTVTIYAPFTNISDTEIFMEGTDFRFFSKPYFLRLHLPGEVTEDSDHSTAKWDSDQRSFVIKAAKVTAGEDFPGLDMLTSLLTPKGEVNLRSESLSGGKIECLDAPGEEDEEEIDWYVDQQVPQEESEVKVILDGGHGGYGFGFRETGVFDRLLQEYQELLDIKTPDKMTHKQRSEARVEKELADFDPDHYLADLFEAEESGIDLLLSYKTVWSRIAEAKTDEYKDKLLKFSEEEQNRMISLPRKEILLDKDVVKSVYYGLLDILFAYCYDVRVTEGEHSSESGWNINKISPTLSSLERHFDLTQCVVACVRRSLVYPLYRNFDLSLRVWRDVLDLLKAGKVALVKALIEIIPIFVEAEGRYIFNQLYIEPYAVWVQSLSPGNLQGLVQSLEKRLDDLDKVDLDLELDELEAAAGMVVAEKEEYDQKTLMKSLDKMKIKEEESSSDSSDSSEDSSSSSDDSSDSSDESDSSEDEEQPVKDEPKKKVLIEVLSETTNDQS